MHLIGAQLVLESYDVFSDLFGLSLWTLHKECVTTTKKEKGEDKNKPPKNHKAMILMRTQTR